MTTVSHVDYQYAGVCEGVHVFRTINKPRRGFLFLSEAKIMKPDGKYRVYNPVPETCSTISFSEIRDEIKLYARK